MSHDSSIEEYVFRLSREELQEELERRALPTSGIWHTCRVRLIKILRSERENSGMANPAGQLNVPEIRVTPELSTARSPEPALPTPARERGGTGENLERIENASYHQGDGQRGNTWLSPLTTNAAQPRDAVREPPREENTLPHREPPPRTNRAVHFEAERMETRSSSPRTEPMAPSDRPFYGTQCADCARRYHGMLGVQENMGRENYRYENIPPFADTVQSVARPCITGDVIIRQPSYVGLAPVQTHYTASDVPPPLPPRPSARSASAARSYGGASERTSVTHAYPAPLTHASPAPPIYRPVPIHSYYGADDRNYSPRGNLNGRYERSQASIAYDIMRRWNLSFSGKSGEDGNAFLTRIQEGRRLVNIADADLLCCLPFFLKDIALYWYRSQYASWSTWEDFAFSFRARFVDPDFQQSLREEILRRTQGEAESVADFITCVRAMAERLIPVMSERELVTIIHRNMSPRLQVVIPRETIYSLGHLEATASRIERSYVLSRTFRPPPLPEHSLLPDLAYRGPRSKGSKNLACALNEEFAEADAYAMSNRPTSKSPGKSVEKNVDSSKTPSNPSNTSQSIPVSTSSAVNASNNTNPFIASETALPSSTVDAPPLPPRAARRIPRCWNCQEEGHIFRFCPKPVTIFCYSCGKRDVTRVNCPRCSENANGQGQ